MFKNDFGSNFIDVSRPSTLILAVITASMAMNGLPDLVENGTQ